MSALGILSPARLVRLVAADAMNIARDPMLIVATLMSITPAIAYVLAKEQMDAAASAAWGIEAISRFVAPVALVLPAFLIGWVTGFLLLEDRDEGMLAALDITPIGKAGFLGYRVGVTAFITFGLTLLSAAMIVPELSPWSRLLITVLVAAEAVIAAVTLAAFARNKVEGLALTKLINIAAVTALIAAIPSPLRFIGGIIPTYWVGELLHLTSTAPIDDRLVAVLALSIHAILVVALLKTLAGRAG
jgi:fluoroquinolone transport system permease protein